MRQLLKFPGITFLLFIVWKVVLFAVTVQPIPSNDAFFYDGAVVNAIHGGRFINPSVALARPYSGTEFFSAYPLFYQFALLGWMKVFGATALAAMAFHLVVVVLWTGVIYLILRRLKLPLWLMHLGGGFLFALTFHDRPDTLGHLFGAVALLFAVNRLARGDCGPSLWSALPWLLLAFGVSVQLGAAYTGIVGVTVLVFVRATGAAIPWAPLFALGVAPIVLLLAARFAFPAWWIGFLENAQNNPSSPGLHIPGAGGVLKLLRTLPGALLVIGLAGLALGRQRRRPTREQGLPFAVFVGATFGIAAISGLGLCLLTANYIPAFATNLQPLVVGSGLALLMGAEKMLLPRWLVVASVSCAILVGSVRAIGMSTWGWWCARNVSYGQARAAVAESLESAASQDQPRPAVLSAAYLYDAYPVAKLCLIHSDYLVLLEGKATKSDLEGLLALKPARLILTQFDYYRRYETTIAQLRREHGDVQVEIRNLARVQSPDAIPSMRKVIQHISWAPVIIDFEWPTGAMKRE